MGRGGRSPSSLEGTSPRRDPSATLAPADRWAALSAGPSFLGLSRSRELSQKIRAFALRPGDDPSRPSPIHADDFERIWAEAVTKPATPTMRDRKGTLDVLVSGLFANPEARVGWECKVENNRRGPDIPVICRLHPDAVGQTQDPAEQGALLLAALGQAHLAYCEQHSVIDSRLVFLWGEPAQGRMSLWQEPYYPAELSAEDFGWKLTPGGLQARLPSGELVFSWYRRGAQFKYHVSPPAKPDLVIKLPRHSLDDRTYARALTGAA